MKALGTPITLEDLQTYSPARKVPIYLEHEFGKIYNVPPPTQGLVSLSILGILDHLKINGEHEGKFVHAAVEATKQAFLLRDNYITDPNHMKEDAQSLIRKQNIFKMANNVNIDRASTPVKGKGPGDTVWLGVMDNKGYSVSYIQSIYHIFGSGVFLPKTGILWQNRAVSFSLNKDHILYITPGKKPFHTLNPAAAKLSDGRVIVYGTRGGDGQSQTQTAIFHRKGGHKIKLLEPFSETMGHAGALVRHANGMMEGAFDPRSDGSAAGF
ncbi:hypothetical protein ACJJTC_009332 [Scirpophaga incertulas]